MNYREKMRKAIECPQFSNSRYGEWGALQLEQRTLIRRLLDEMDNADNYIKKLYFENEKLINKQKDFVKYLKDERERCLTFYNYTECAYAYDVFTNVLSKYKEIIGGENE